MPLRFGRRVLQAGALLAATCLLAACPLRVGGRGDDPLVSAGSPVVAGIAASAAAVAGLMEAREVYRLAGRESAVRAIDAYLERLALARLLGVAEPQAATIADVVEGKASPGAITDPAVARSQTLRGALKPEGLGWGGATVTMNARNAGMHTITSALPRLVLDRRDGNLDLECHAAGGGRPDPLPPGKTGRYYCSVDKDAYAAMERSPQYSGWRIEARHLEFGDPPVEIFPDRVFWRRAWIDGAADAHRRLHEASCEARGACDQEAFARAWNSRLRLPLTGAVAGVAVGCLFSLPRRRRMTLALLGSLVLGGAIAAYLFGIAGKDWPLLLLAGLPFVPLLVLPYALAMFGTLALIGRWRPETRPDASAPG